jgi:hypothetical protein
MMKTQVKVFKGNFDSKAYSKLAKTDAVAVIGKSENVVKAVQAFNPTQAKTLSENGFGSNHGSISPEDSQNPRTAPEGGSHDNVIALATDATKTFAKSTNSSFEDAGAFLINHGAGHLSNLDHAGDDNGYDDQGNYQRSPIFVPGGPNVMSSGADIVNGSGNTPLSNYTSSPSNQQPANKQQSTLSIKQANIRRFGNDAPAAKLPTQ